MATLENPIDRGTWGAIVLGVAELGSIWACPWRLRQKQRKTVTEISHTHTHNYFTVECASVFTQVWKNRSDQISRSVMSDSLPLHESKYARPPCPSPTPGVHPDSGPSSQWCHLAISSSVVPFSSCPQSLPASESFPTSQLFTWGGQSTAVSALASFLPKKSQGWSPSEWTGWISLQSKGLSESSPTPQFKSINSSALSLLHSPTLTSIHDHRKNHSLD